MCAEENSNGEEAPSHHRPTSRDVDPLLAGIFHGQRAKREGKWDGEPDVAEIEHRRMDHHLRILEKRVETVAVRRDCAGNDCERMGGEVQVATGKISGRQQ